VEWGGAGVRRLYRECQRVTRRAASVLFSLLLRLHWGRGRQEICTSWCTAPKGSWLLRMAGRQAGTEPRTRSCSECWCVLPPAVMGK
jgi:hypothetical protein